MKYTFVQIYSIQLFKYSTLVTIRFEKIDCQFRDRSYGWLTDLGSNLEFDTLQSYNLAYYIVAWTDCRKKKQLPFLKSGFGYRVEGNFFVVATWFRNKYF